MKEAPQPGKHFSSEKEFVPEQAKLSFFLAWFVCSCIIFHATTMNIMYTSTTTGDAREEIVDKLHGALAAFRRERDELHRKKELAAERLQLVKEEQQAIERTVHAMQENLNQLNKTGSEEAKKDLEQMEKDVDQLHRTVSPEKNCFDIA